MEDTTNKTLQLLDKAGLAIWLNADGDYSCRLSTNGEINKMGTGKLKKVLSSKLKRSVSISEDDDADDADVKSFDLLLVSEEVFEPQYIWLG